MTAPVDVEKLRRVADRLAALGCEPEAEEIVATLRQPELAWLAAEFERRAEVCRAAASELEVTLRAAARGEARR